VSFILYPPWGLAQWDQFDHRQMMLVTMTFAWHLGITVLIQVLLKPKIIRKLNDIKFLIGLKMSSLEKVVLCVNGK
jgi:hypothetical protein